jgi:ribonuclease PH
VEKAEKIDEDYEKNWEDLVKKVELEDCLKKIVENVMLVDQYPNTEIDVVFKVFHNSLCLKHYLTLALGMALLHSGLQTKAILLPCSAIKNGEDEIVIDPSQQEWDEAGTKVFL